MISILKELNIFQWFSLSAFLFGVLLTFWIITRIPFHVVASSTCLERGYKDYQLDYKYNTYCINTFNTFTEIKELK